MHRYIYIIDIYIYIYHIIYIHNVRCTYLTFYTYIISCTYIMFCTYTIICLYIYKNREQVCMGGGVAKGLILQGFASLCMSWCGCEMAMLHFKRKTFQNII